MPDQNIKTKQALIQQLRGVAEKETAWLEKNRLLYTAKRSRLDSLMELRSESGDGVSSEEHELSKQVALYESRRSGMWDLAKEINQEEQNLSALTSCNDIRSRQL